MGEFLRRFVEGVRSKGSLLSVRGMVALPRLVYGAETGDPEPAEPIALVHLLWWAGARYLDDLADDEDLAGGDRRETGRGVVTALAVGSHLPERVLSGLAVSDAVRAGLWTELARGWLDAVGGQVGDLSADPASATPESVLRGYQGKTGGPYGMAAAMAAVLAGADPGRVDRWREFGRDLGVLRQLVNDQRDLDSGRHEDLRNATATYRLALLANELDAGGRAELLALLAAARRDKTARRKLAAWLLEEGVARRYATSLTPLVSRAHRALDQLGGFDLFVRGLRALVDETTAFLGDFPHRPS